MTERSTVDSTLSDGRSRLPGMTQTLLAIGTRKGLWLARSDDGRATWQVDGPHFRMQAVYAVAIDTRGAQPRVLVGADSPHWGPSVFRSDDLGASWQETEKGAMHFPADTGATLARVWQLAPGRADEPDVVWAGAEPSTVWRSEDRGETFELVRGLWEHPDRPHWEPGFGGMAVHTVLPHPRERDRVLVAMSAGGVYTTSDGGDSWSSSNSGLEAYFMTDKYPAFGQCVHKVARDAADPSRLYLQNHGGVEGCEQPGVYRSDDGGATWVPHSEGLPETTFGFTVVAHPSRGGTAWVFPLVADGERWPHGGHAAVYRTTDAGDSWHVCDKGLPQGLYAAVLRDAMSADDCDPAGLYLGTRTGSVYASRDEAESWTELVRDLPDVLSVRAATVG